MDRKKDPRPLNQRFLMTLIFVCVGCLAQQSKVNRKYNTIKRLFTTKLS